MNEYGIYPLAYFTEPVSSLTHLIGAVIYGLLSIPLMVRAWRGPRDAEPHAPRRLRVVSVGVFCVSIVLLLSISGLYHLAAFETGLRRFFLRLDYAAIFVLIAGTFTPACTILFQRFGRWGGLAFIWSGAVGGILLNTIYFSDIPPIVLHISYLLLGWTGVFAVYKAWRRYGPSFIEPVVLGGVAYTAGAAFHIAMAPEIVPGIIGPHELLHFAVLIGIAWHWKFIYQFAHGHVPLREELQETPQLAVEVVQDS